MRMRDHEWLNTQVNVQDTENRPQRYPISKDGISFQGRVCYLKYLDLVLSWQTISILIKTWFHKTDFYSVVEIDYSVEENC